MFSLNLKIALRNIWKYKVYTLINVLGLSIGMASCILIFIFIRYQLSFDGHFANKDRIYRIVSHWEGKGTTDFSQGVPIPLSKAVRNDMPQLEKVAAIQNDDGVIIVHDQANKVSFKENVDVFYTQPDFFDIFDFKWLSGNPQASLSQPNTVVLSEEKAVKYFGDWQKAVGKILRFKNSVDLKVTGVFKGQPENTSLPLNVVISYASNPLKDWDQWGSVASTSECYVLLKQGLTISSLDGTLAQFNKKYYNNDTAERQFNTFQSLNEIHLNGRYGNFSNRSIDKKEIYSLAVIGAFLLLTACINFINLATAQAVSRSKEVGIRKVLGSRRNQLVMQFLSETFTISLISVLIACAIAEFALPYMQNLFAEKISFSMLEHPVIFVFLIVLVLVVSFLAGLYPALIISGFSPIKAINNKVKSGAGGLGLRRILVVIQFSLTVVLIIATLIVLKQMNYLRQRPLGFTSDAIAMINIPWGDAYSVKQEQLKTRLKLIPGIKNLSYCNIPPSSVNVSERTFSLNGIDIKDFSARVINADDQYFETFGLKLMAGKLLSKSDTTNGYVVNQTFLKKMNLQHAEQVLGKILDLDGQKAAVIGIIADFNDKSLHQGISPIVISSRKTQYFNMAIKMESQQMMSSMKEVERLWEEFFPDEVYHSSILNDSLIKYYHNEQVMGVLFKVFSGIIIFISFIGLFGLVSFVVSQRSAEVAIRKVLGASNYELVNLLNSSFLVMVLVANLVAWPIAYIFVRKWLNAFAYQIPLSIWPFAIALAITFTITLITVSLHAYKVAKTNPLDALKCE